jgi:hypothetical protein
MLVALLISAYPRAAWPEPTRSLYVETLSGFDHLDGRRAIERTIATSDWPPSIAELRRTVAEQRLALPSEIEAWELAVDHAAARGPGAPRRYCLACAATGRTVDGLCPECEGTGDEDVLDLDRMPPVPDPIPAAVRAVGGWRTIRTSERPEHLRRDFVDAYRRLRAEAIERESLAAVGADGGHRLVEETARREIEG